MDTSTVPQPSVSHLENPPRTTPGTSPVPQPSGLPHSDSHHYGKSRTAVGYVRVSTSMQADDGLSLEAQRAAITAYCSSHDLRLVRIYQDVESGAKCDRTGLRDALATQAAVLVVLKFDRISRSIKHFCQLYEDYFAHTMELVAIRESIKLDSALGRALVSILLVFAQMERESTGERTRETIRHIHSMGYFFGKVPYGKRAVPAPENPRYRILVDDEEEQKVLAHIKTLFDSGIGPTQAAAILNGQQIAPPQGPVWTLPLVYNFKRRLGWHIAKPHNARNHTDQEVQLIRAAVCEEAYIEPVGALRYNAFLAIGALAVENGFCFLRATRPLQGLSLSELDQTVDFVAREAARLRQVGRSSSIVAAVFRGFTD